MNSHILHLLRLVSKEMWSKPTLTIIIYLITSFAFLTAAWVWPRIYTSTSVVLVDSESILSPLMKGTAVTTDIVDESKRARQIILSKSSIEKILKLPVWQDDVELIAPPAGEPLDEINEKGDISEIDSILANDTLTANGLNKLALVSDEGELLLSNRTENETAQESMDTKRILGEASSLKTTKNELSEEEMLFEVQSRIIKLSTTVKNLGGNLVEISYESGDPQIAFETAKLLTSIFVNESILAKQSESRSAFEFIDEQVSIYQVQLNNAETAIKEFRSKNVESTPGTGQNASAKLIELNAELETAELRRSAENASIIIRQRQLRGELRESSSDIAKETLLSERIVDLQARLSELLLSYKETYPDVVQVKSQIQSLKTQLNIITTSGNDSLVAKKPTPQVAQEFRRQILLSENEITALDSRIEQLTIRINRERGVLSKIISVEADIAELNRDQTINQEMYNRLLSQRENARVSMNIDIQKQGLSMKVQDYATLPYLPEGLRFAHIILAGLLLSFFAPAAVVFLLAELDQKVRSDTFFRDTFKVPIIATLSTLPSLTDTREGRLKMSLMLLVVVAVWCIYAYAIYLKRLG